MNYIKSLLCMIVLCSNAVYACSSKVCTSKIVREEDALGIAMGQYLSSSPGTIRLAYLDKETGLTSAWDGFTIGSRVQYFRQPNPRDIFIDLKRQYHIQRVNDKKWGVRIKAFISKILNSRK